MILSKIQSLFSQSLPGGVLQEYGLYRILSLALLLWGFYSLMIYPFWISPVRQIPGPWWARVTKLPLRWATLKKRRSAFCTALLEKYGSIVVIAPDQVHTTDEAAMKIIYDRSSTKTDFYSNMGSWKGVTSTLGFKDYRSAAPSRNNLLQCFQNRNLSVLVQNIESHIDDFLRLLEKSPKKNELVDGVVVFRLLALDIVTDVLWGETDTLLGNENAGEEEAPVFLSRFHAFSNWNALKSFIPALDILVRVAGTKAWKRLRNDCNDMDVTAREALARWNEAKNGANREKDVLSMLQSMNSSTRPAVPVDDIPAYMVEMLAAGSSTTSHTAAFACHLLSHYMEAQDTLRQELFDKFPDPKDIQITEMMDLPFLDGVLRETMRIYPMIPGPLERHLGKDITVNGKHLPKGVVASTAAYNQGRLGEVFENPDEWIPGRWIDSDERMRLNWIPFGHGCRSCPGSNLAMTELKYMIGKIFRLYRAVLPRGHESEELELADVFAAGSRSGHVWLQFAESADKVRCA